MSLDSLSIATAIPSASAMFVIDFPFHRSAASSVDAHVATASQPFAAAAFAAASSAGSARSASLAHASRIPSPHWARIAAAFPLFPALA